MPFDNSYSRLPEKFFQRIPPTKVKHPELIRFNQTLAEELGLSVPEDHDRLAELFSGNELLEGTAPIAQAYAGHQFGHFVPQLGDGRAVLLGEFVNENGIRNDIQLKGAGRTRFSRNGDGRSPLGPVIREYIISEAMHNMGVPTTRSLAMVSTGETVFREEELPGAVLTRVASSHIRVGTFEFFAARGDHEALQILADYVIDRHYPQLKKYPNPYPALLERVCDRQAELVAKWMSIGFIHGVMNTDNTTISGETIDYGPCAFMDRYDPATVFSSIDQYGRYAYGSQPKIMQWNLSILAGCLLPLLHENSEQAKIIAEPIIQSFQETFKREYFSKMCKKIGLDKPDEKFIELLNHLLEMMHEDKADFHLTFRALAGVAESGKNSFKEQFSTPERAEKWLKNWQTALRRIGISNEAALKTMRKANPAYIPRNHRVEEAINHAVENGDYSYLERLIKVLDTPFEDHPENIEYSNPPKPSEQVYQTFCGT